MNKAHLALDSHLHNSRELSSTSSVREIEWPVPTDLPITSLIQLFTEVENALHDTGGVLVQFVCITSGRGSEHTAMDMAWAAATVLGRDILVVNATSSFSPSPVQASAQPRIGGPVDSSALSVQLEPHMIKVAGHGLYVANLRDVYRGNRALAATDEIIANLRKLSPRMDMIVIAGPPAEIDPFAATLARHVDGNVLVIEAEETRRSDAIRMRQILSRCGRPLLGTFLNNRRSHIPQWLRRWL